MSRCFPFPPPGYEKKLIPEVANILKKEKTKEKKHKEKKDKEKKEGKDRRDKEKSNGKHREKEDKKDKHKDKTKDREKSKEKDQEKGSTSVEKKVSGQGEEYRAEVQQKEKARGEERKEQSGTSEKNRQISPVGYCNGEKLHHQKVEKGKEKRNTADETNYAMQLQDHTGGNKTVLHSFADEDSQDSKFMLEFSKRISVEGKGSGSQLVEGFMDGGFKKVESIDNFAVRDTCTVVEGKEKIKDKQVDKWKIDGQGIHREEKFNGNAMCQNLSGSMQNTIGVSKSKDNFEGTMEGKEKSKERERDGKRGEKRKSKHKDKQSQGKDKNSEKEKRKEGKSKKDRHKSEKDNSRSSNKNDIGTPNNKTSHFSKDSDKNAATEGILNKRKDVEKNGFLPEYVVKPGKKPRLDSHPLSANGQELEHFQTTTLFTSKKQGTTNNFVVDNKDNQINGLTGLHQLPISAPKPSPVIAEQIDEASRKPPHPDMKYLSKVLLVPQMDEWSEVDDQAWLHNNKDSLLNNSKVDPVGVNQGQQVWADTLRIESADVFALPYVIPY